MTIYKVTCVLDQFEDEVLYDKLFEIGAISIDISDYKNDSFLDNTNVFFSEISEKWEKNRLEILFNCQSQNNFELILEKLKKRDLYNHINNVNLLNEELEKTNQLLSKIDNIIQENTEKTNNNILGATFKNKSKVINIMSKQKYIAENKKGFLLEQKNKTDLEIAKIFIQKDKIEKKVYNKKLEFSEYQDLKLEITNRNFKKN